MKSVKWQESTLSELFGDNSGIILISQITRPVCVQDSLTDSELPITYKNFVVKL